MTEEVLILVITTSGHLALGIAVWRRQPAERVNQCFAFLCVVLAAWTLANGLVKTYAASPWGFLSARAAFASASLLPFALFSFATVFPTRMTVPSSRVRATVVAAALAAFALSWTPLIARRTASVDGALQVTYGPLHAAFGAYLISVLAYSLLLLARKLRVLKGIERLQVRYVFLGVALTALGGTVTNLLIPLVFHTSRFSPYGPVFGILMILLIAHAIVRYRLMNIRLVVRRGVTELLAFAVAGSALVVLARFASGLLASPPRELPLWVWLVLVLAVAQLFQPLRRWIQTGLDYYFFREPYNYQRVLREISRTMGGMVDLPALARYVGEALGRTVRPEAVAIYAKDIAGRGYARIAARLDQGEPAPRETIEDGSPLVRALARDQRHLLADELGRGTSDPDHRAVLDELRRQGAECALPILGNGALTGFLLLGPKRSGDPYFAEDIDLLSTVAGQTAIAIKNAQLYAQVQRAEGEKRRAERLASVGALASGIAHEIKNPLVAIKTFAELLPERMSDADFRGEFSLVMLREIERIDQLVARLRGLAAPPAERFTPVHLREPIEETLALLRGQLERLGVKVDVAYDSPLPFVAGDPAQLKQLCLNLFMNAVEAMNGGGELTISVRGRSVLGDQRLALEVRDSGPGIPEVLLSKIFDPFVTTKAQGSGLGLSICRAIADAHRAAIRAENNPRGPGARVIVEFPVLPHDHAGFDGPVGVAL